MKKIFNSEGGFTLVELIIVFGVIGILVGMILTVVDPISQIQKSKDAQRKSDLSQIQKILEQFYQDNGGKYPKSSTAEQTCGSPQQSCSYRIINLSDVIVEWGNAFSPYANVLPKDPVAGRKYVYYSPSNSNGQTYYLYASLERGTKDTQACSSGVCSGSGPSGPDLTTACGGKCNYGVSSTNTNP